MGKSAKVACPLPPRRVLATQWLIARNQRRLFGMHGEVKAATPLRHDRHDPLGVRFRLAADDTIIGKTPKKTPPLHAGLHHCDKPFVQDMMQQDIGQQWRRLSPYKVANFFFRDRYHLDTGRSETRD